MWYLLPLRPKLELYGAFVLKGNNRRSDFVVGCTWFCCMKHTVVVSFKGRLCCYINMVHRALFSHCVVFGPFFIFFSRVIIFGKYNHVKAAAQYCHIFHPVPESGALLILILIICWSSKEINTLSFSKTKAEKWNVMLVSSHSLLIPSKFSKHRATSALLTLRQTLRPLPVGIQGASKPRSSESTVCCIRNRQHSLTSKR